MVVKFEVMYFKPFFFSRKPTYEYLENIQSGTNNFDQFFIVVYISTTKFKRIVPRHKKKKN